MKVLITAAFGHQGKVLIPKLAAAGFDVRAARGSPGREEEVLRLGAREVFVGDLSDPKVYTEALNGCDAVYHIGPGAHPRELEMGYAMVKSGLNFTALRPCDYMLQEAYIAPALRTGAMPFVN